MKLKDSLTDIVRNPDNAYLASGAYAVGRFGDVIITILGIEKYGQIEGLPQAQFFIEKFGTRNGLIIHELAALAVMIGLYKFLSKKKRVHQNRVLYVSAVASASAALYNLHLFLDKL